MNPGNESTKRQERALERLISITDDVFAFAITLLVLDLTVPTLTSTATSADLWAALKDQYVTFLDYALSFLIAGAWWTSHNRNFEKLNGADGTLRWLNLLFLLWIALLPFFTKLLSDFIILQLAVDLYAGDQVAAGLFMTLIWWYATKNHRLVDRSLPDSTVRTTLLLDAGTTLWFVLSICVSFVSLAVTVYMWLGVFPAHRLMHYIWRDPMK